MSSNDLMILAGQALFYIEGQFDLWPWTCWTQPIGTMCWYLPTYLQSSKGLSSRDLLILAGQAFLHWRSVWPWTLIYIFILIAVMMYKFSVYRTNFQYIILCNIYFFFSVTSIYRMLAYNVTVQIMYENRI